VCNNSLDDALYAIVAGVLGRQSHPIVAESSLPREERVVRQWESLPVNTVLPLVDGGSCRLLFPGLHGGPAGPDVRDAILLFTGEEVQRVGAVEFHVCTSDWFTHGHHTDSRYNNVLLHVVLIHDRSAPTLCQNGQTVPTCSLNDLPIALKAFSRREKHSAWPCDDVLRDLSDEERDVLLHRAGLLRFEQKAHAFVEQLHRAGEDEYDTAGCDKSDLYSGCLVLALAEGLAYGRDRAFFRAATQHLLGHHKSLPEPLGRAPAPSLLDAQRLRVLRAFVERRQEMWQRLRTILMNLSNEDTLLTLQTYFSRFGLGLTRTDILLCNVVFPFAAAIALLEHDIALEKRAQHLYESHPGLSSNAITRMMSAQLQLADEPHGSCRQQGLHYIYQQTCQAKECAICMMGRSII
jgi:hypothetical protein